MVQLQSPAYSGYEADISTGSFSNVSGSWVQPAATCSGDSYSSVVIWVGLQDNVASQLEQIGTELDCYLGSTTALSFAWYEMAPASSRAVSLEVSPGDRIAVRVNASGADFGLAISNLSTGQSFSTQQTGTAAPTRAQWIVEAPSSASSGKVFALTNFSKITISNAGASANDQRGPILDSDWWGIVTWQMAGPDGISKDIVSGLLPDNSFSVTWRGP